MPAHRAGPAPAPARPGAATVPATVVIGPPPGGNAGDRTRAEPVTVAGPAAAPDVPVVPGFGATREIARGGMGVVYAARDPVFDREVAVKVMLPGRDAGRFVVEAKVTAQLPHPGVPPVYALGVLADGRPFLAMKLIEGRTLAHELAALSRADRPRLLSAFESVCQTVGFAHARGIVHRDLKPANVMVGRFGETLVMDWGLATGAGRATAPGGPGAEPPAPPAAPAPCAAPALPDFDGTPTGLVNGTPAYMAPEQARGEPLDARADVFALGGILAVILTGRPPFLGETVWDTIREAARANTAACLAELDACGADADLVALAKRCLAADPADRFATGEDVAGALAAYRAGVGERLRRAERDRAAADGRADEQRKRRQAQLALAAVVALVLTGAAALAWHSDRQASARRRADERAEADRRADEARRAGEWDAEQRLKSEQARQAVAAHLDLAADLRRQYKFAEAAAALAQAAALAGGAPELLGAAQRARDDLALVVELDRVRFRKWVYFSGPGGKGAFNTKAAPTGYRRAFAARGLDLAELDPAAAAERLAASGARAELIAAAADWALYEPDPALRDRLLAIARTADPGPWTDRLRDPAVWARRDAVAALAADAVTAAPSSAALTVLAELMERWDLDPAPLLSAARAKHPTDFELAFALGLWHDTHGRAGRPLGPYEAARALRPDNLAVWVNLGNVLSELGDAPGAVAAFKEAARLDPQCAPVHFNLGIALTGARDMGGAIAAYKEAVRLDPRFPRAHYGLGVALFETGDGLGAIAAYKEAVRLDPRFTKAHYNLGLALKAAGDLDGAAAAYRAAIRLEPDAEAHNNLGNVLSERGDREGAIAAYKEAARLDPRFPRAHYNLGVALKAAGDLDGAAAAYRAAIRLDPRFIQAHINLGVALKAAGDREGAIAAYREAIRLDPRSAPAHFNLGVALKAAGDREGAIAAYREAIRLDPQFAPAHSAAGVALSERGDVPGAVAAYQEVVKLSPRDAQAHTNLGALYLGQKKYAEAAACARAAIVADPEYSAAHALLGFTLQQAGDGFGARAALAQAARLDARWAPMFAKLPPVPPAPPPREVPLR